MEFIRKYLELSAKLSSDDWQIFSSKLSRKEFLKGSILLKSGQTENYLSFVESGIIRYFVPREEKEDHPIGFVFENNFISGYESFLTRQPSAYAIEALRKSVIWRLSYEDLQEIYTRTEAGNLIGRLAAEGIYMETSKRELSFLTQTPEQRYLNLLSEQPELIRHIPLKYLASYIGISPQALSRIRKRIS